MGPSGPNWVAAGPGRVWVDSPRDSAIFRIDWVSVETAAGSPGKLVRLDPVTDGVDRTITLGGSFGGNGDIAVAGGSAWVVDEGDDRILRHPLAAFEP